MFVNLCHNSEHVHPAISFNVEPRLETMLRHQDEVQQPQGFLQAPQALA